MHPPPPRLPRPLRVLGVLAAGVGATLALWVAATPPATSTVAPGAMGPR
jgi:hypothetical protein